MTDSRTKFRFGFWPIVLLGITLLYPLSFGPACWISQRTGANGAVVSAVYQPVLQVACRSPLAVATCVLNYAQWGMHPGQRSFFSKDHDSGYCRLEIATRFGRIR
jgi:hypothetical protein